MKEYKKDAVHGRTQADVIKELGLDLKPNSYGAMVSCQQSNSLTTIDMGKYDKAFICFLHYKIEGYTNIFEGNMLLMKKTNPSAKSPKLWKNRLPKILFYDNDMYYGIESQYSFKGVYEFARAEPDDSIVYLRKIGSTLIVDEENMTLKWRT